MTHGPTASVCDGIQFGYVDLSQNGGTEGLSNIGLNDLTAIDPFQGDTKKGCLSNSMGVRTS